MNSTMLIWLLINTQLTMIISISKILNFSSLPQKCTFTLFFLQKLIFSCLVTESMQGPDQIFFLFSHVMEMEGGPVDESV